MFGPGALAFYDGLEADNSRDYWQAHQAEWEREVRQPMRALTEALADEFGEASLFRPHRDTRFSADKSPYKTHQGAFAAVSKGTGYYVEISADGLRVGGGFHAQSTGQTARFRQAVDSAATGPAIAGLLDALRASGYELRSDSVKTAPRGYSADHPRIETLRYKDLMVVKPVGAPDWLGTDRVVDEVRASWREVRPVVEWVTEHVGPA